MTVGVFDVASGGVDTYNEKTKASGFIPIAQMDNFVCLNPTDAQTVLSYIAAKK